MKYEKCTGNVKVPKNIPTPQRGFTSAPVTWPKKRGIDIATVKVKS